MNILFWSILIGVAGFLFSAFLSSLIEKEYRAGGILLLLFFLFILLIILPLFVQTELRIFKFAVILTIGTLFLLFLIPIKSGKKQFHAFSAKRFHEADAVLSRRRLKPGSPNYTAYYNLHPEFKKADDLARQNPGLLSESSKYYDPVTFSAADANFILTDHLHQLEGLPSSKEKKEVDAQKMPHFIEQWLIKTGAHSVGFTPLKDHHLYSHKGRGPRTGEEITNALPHAIAFTVEMDHEMMKSAPAGPTVMESSEQYLRAGILATKLAIYIKQMGYKALVHIDGSYDVICPVLASDAGLGVIGRMGLLMTPKLGPRVRIAAVTTDLPLEYSIKKNDFSTIDFCKTCKKCAQVCPANAIPKGEMEEVGGNKRWKINSEACYNFWTTSGTDCGRCMISCPFAHHNNWFHRFIRWGIKNNLLFRRMAVKLDDVFYEAKPSIRPLPDWLNFTNKK